MRWGVCAIAAFAPTLIWAPAARAIAWPLGTPSTATFGQYGDSVLTIPAHTAPAGSNRLLVVAISSGGNPERHERDLQPAEALTRNSDANGPVNTTTTNISVSSKTGNHILDVIAQGGAFASTPVPDQDQTLQGSYTDNNLGQIVELPDNDPDDIGNAADNRPNHGNFDQVDADSRRDGRRLRRG